MLILKTLKVAGFRGFANEQEFKFDAAATFLFGENHCGKSSTLNAIEWCLFGEECKGTKTEIRERVHWEFLNRNLPVREVHVELELEGPAGDCVVRRTLKPRDRKSEKLDEQLTVILPDGTKLIREHAEAELLQLMRRFSFKDFMTTVYQHQEVIRGILTQEPRERNDAIDRLLGLSDFRNLMSAIEQAHLAGSQKGLGQRFDAFEGKVRIALETRAGDLKSKRQVALEAGVAKSDQNEKGALRHATGVRESMVEAAEKLGVGSPSCTVPDEWTGLRSFQRWAKADVNRMRSEMPESQKQEELFGQQSSLSNEKERYESRKDDYDAAAKNLRDYEKRHGNEASVDSKVKSARQKRDQARQGLREANLRAALVVEAIEYLEKLSVEPVSLECPLCHHKAPGLLEQLREEYEQKIAKQTEKANERIETLNIEIQNLEELIDQHKDLNKSLSGAEAKLLDSRSKVATLLGKQLEEDDDPVVILNKKLDVITTELTGLAVALKRKQKRLTEIDVDLDKIGLACDILELEQKKSVIESIKESLPFKEIERLRDQAAQLVENVKSVRAAVATASNEEAKDKISAAEKNIDSNFRGLTSYPGLKKLKMTVRPDPKGRNSYEFTTHDDQDLVSILSQGDLNALALSIFLGLACAGGDANPFGFVILDDFSQSLGTEFKVRLVAVLNEVLASKRLILSTMDAEMRKLLDTKLSKQKKTYIFADWTPGNGPSIKLA